MSAWWVDSAAGVALGLLCGVYGWVAVEAARRGVVGLEESGVARGAIAAVVVGIKG